MHIVVFGTGGVGGYFGGRLAQAGEYVTFIARGDHLQAMLANGLTVESINGDFTVKPAVATDDISKVKDVDIVLICVKTWHINQAAQSIKPVLGQNTIVIPLENGVEAPSLLSEALGEEHVMGGLCRIASRITSPGHIHHSGIEPYIAFGELDNRPSSRSQDLLKRFLKAGVKAEIPDDIRVALWKKFLFISAVSGIGAVTRVPMGLFRAQPGSRQMLENVLNECYSLAVAQGVGLPADSVADTLAYIDSLPLNTMASMQRDIMAGSPSELEAQNGAIVHMGQALHIPTPVNSFIYYSLLPQELQARGESKL